MARKRADRGTGSVFYDDTRRSWRVQITLDGTRYVRRAKTKTEALAKRAELVRQHATGDLAANQTITVGEIVTDYVDRSVPDTLADSTLSRYRWAAAHIIEQLGTVKAAKLTSRRVEAALDNLAARPLGRYSVTKVRSLLVAALDDAVGRGELARNLAATSRLPRGLTTQRGRQSLTPDMARRLLDAVAAERNGAMFALMLEAGLRPGEAAGLYWSDIRGHVVNVTRSVSLDSRGRAAVTDGLKTTGSARTLEVSDRLADQLAAHRKAQAAERLAAASWVDPELVFASPTGNVLSPPNVRRQLAEVCNTAGVTVDDNGTSRPPTPNELRHSCASLLSDRGVPNEIIADLLGHTSTRMVDQTYRHRLRPTVAIAREVNWRSATGD